MNKINIFSTLSLCFSFLTACGGDSVAPVGNSSVVSSSSSAKSSSSIASSSSQAKSSSSIASSSSQAKSSSSGQVAEVDVENKTITVRSPSCEITETAAVFNPEGTVSEFSYELSDTTLFLTDEYNDEMSYSGNNSSIYGSWTSSGPECTEMNICETLTITETSISNQPDVSRVCAFDVVSGMFMEMGGGIGTEIKKIDCSNGTATMGNTVITVKINEFGPTKQSLKVSTDSGSCSLETEIKPLTAALCTVANADKINEDTYVSSNDEEFLPCFIGLTLGGFDMDFETSDDGFAKASSKVKAFSKALSTLK